MGTKQSIATYAIRKSGTEQWEFKNELIEDFTVQWIIKKFESYYGQYDFLFVNETDIEADSIGTAALERYFTHTEPKQPDEQSLP